jgi:ribosomal protein S18 acetylase RimI-like enzyme
MKIRIANTEDYEGCIELHTVVVGADRRREFLRDRIEWGKMYVAVISDRIIGLITFETNFIGCLYISLLLVHPDFRRRGIARRLVERVGSYSKDGRLFSSTEEDNEVSRAMHEALGFRKSGYIENLPQPQKEIIYYKYLR